MILVDPRELERYLRWRLAVEILPQNQEALDTVFKAMGTDPICVAGDGKLTSPGNRGAGG